MGLRPKHGVVFLAVLASACAVVTGIDGYSVDSAGNTSSSSSGSATDGGSSLIDANVIPTPEDGGKLPDACTNGQVACENATTAASCENGAWKRTTCPERCNNGACDAYLSCANAAGAGCGKTPTSCCATATVPGGTFNRRNDVTLPATISAFELELYEVTVGRFRAFMAAGGATQANPPAPGSGAHPKIPNSGWHAEWNLRLPSTPAELNSNLHGGRNTWTDDAGPNEHLPINNVEWLEAFAFCAWDGARLPTYAELNFAATGGSEQRLYPWTATLPPPAPHSGAPSVESSFNCNYKAPAKSCSTTCIGCDDGDIAPVGMLPEGVGKFGQFDLAGNVSELTLDLSDPPDEAKPPPVCNDCAVLLSATDPDKAILGTKQFSAQFYQVGGAYDGSDKDLQTSSYERRKYSERKDQQGFRCAREARVTP